MRSRATPSLNLNHATCLTVIQYTSLIGPIRPVAPGRAGVRCSLLMVRSVGRLFEFSRGPRSKCFPRENPAVDSPSRGEFPDSIAMQGAIASPASRGRQLAKESPSRGKSDFSEAVAIARVVTRITIVSRVGHGVYAVRTPTSSKCRKRSAGSS